MADRRGFKRKVREQVLRSRGLEAAAYGRIEKAKPEVRKVRLAGSRYLKVVIPPKSDGLHKTLAMRLVELRINQPLEDVLWLGTLREVAGALGVDYTTISRWRKKLTNGGMNGATGT